MLSDALQEVDEAGVRIDAVKSAGDDQTLDRRPPALSSAVHVNVVVARFMPRSASNEGCRFPP